MRLVFLLAAGIAAYGQSPSFEVASIKPAPPREPNMPMRVGCQGGPGTNDPGRWACENISVGNLISMAFEVRHYELLGLTDPFGGDRYQISAKVPEGTTKEQFRQMQQHLLAERFGLKFHREQKEMTGYELTVAKNGPKLTESGPETPPPDVPNTPPAALPRLTMGKDGYPDLPPGRSGSMMMNGMATHRAYRSTMAQLASMLSGQVGRPVSDATGLTGKYDYTLKWTTRSGPAPPPPGAEGPAPAPEFAGPTIFTAIQEQLGLKLESKKVMVELFVVDHVSKSPTEN